MTAMKAAPASTFLLKIESLRLRAKLLNGLRATVGLKPRQDIRPEQWEVIESQLAAVSNKVQQQLRLYTDKYLSDHRDPKIRPVVAIGSDLVFTLENVGAGSHSIQAAKTCNQKPCKIIIESIHSSQTVLYFCDFVCPSGVQ